jgi:hypothetical protein
MNVVRVSSPDRFRGHAAWALVALPAVPVYGLLLFGFYYFVVLAIEEQDVLPWCKF